MTLAVTTFRRTLRSDDSLAIELTTVLKQGDVERLSRLLAAEPDLASCVVRNEKGGGRTPLHLFADWPGQIPLASKRAAGVLTLRTPMRSYAVIWRDGFGCTGRK
jgi:hypothetical protein